jgi:hypothetical protein
MYFRVLSTEEKGSDVNLAVDVVKKKLRHGPLQASQLPHLLRDSRGEIHRPRLWRPT